jgi:hypothetical protein
MGTKKKAVVIRNCAHEPCNKPFETTELSKRRFCCRQHKNAAFNSKTNAARAVARGYTQQEKVCIDCGTNIAHRDFRAKLCEDCARKRYLVLQKNKAREWQGKNHNRQGANEIAAINKLRESLDLPPIISKLVPCCKCDKGFLSTDYPRERKCPQCHDTERRDGWGSMIGA